MKNAQSPSQGPVRTDVVVMEEHFLYLPLYYAKHRNFFGFVPSRYDIGIVPSSDRTDLSAFRMLMDTTSEENSKIDFAVGDPSVVFDSGLGASPTPVVLAELVSNTAFWAIDRRSKQITFVKDLAAFDNIIAFFPGTSSYGIASRIYRDAGKPESIKQVRPGQELVALKKSKKGTVALSPDILGIEHFLFNNAEFDIDLVLGTTPEYNSVFLTGLLTRSDVAAEHPDLVAGLLKAIQKSVLLVRLQTSDVIRYANERFLGYGEQHVISALKRADDGRVFPTTIEVNEAHWISAARVSWDARGMPFDATAQTEAIRVYKQAIVPYGHFAKAAVTDIYSGLATELDPTPPKPSISTTYGQPLVWLLLGAIAAKWFHWSAPIALALAMLAGVFVAKSVGLTRGSLGHWIHCLFLSAIFVLFVGWQTYAWRWDVFVPIIVALILAEVGVIHSESKKH